MNHIFDIGEQVAELGMMVTETKLLGLELITSRHWAEFMLEDAKNQLRAKHYRVDNNHAARLIRMVIKIAKAEDNREIVEFYSRLNLGYEVEDEFVHRIEDALDEFYYESSLEIGDFINVAVRNGELWTCSLSGSHLLFSFCCSRSMVEASIRASGGNYSQFVKHLLG